MNMPLLNLIIQPLLGAAAGYITNEYAINMLFKTYTPLKLGGVIPKTREAFIENVSRLVEEDIINKEKVEAILNDESFTRNFDSLVKDFFTGSIYEISDNFGIGDNSFTGKALSDTEEFINTQIESKLPELINLLSANLKLGDMFDENQIIIIVERLYSYMIKLFRDMDLSDKLVLNIINKNQNVSLMDIAGYDISAIISQNISDLFFNIINIKNNYSHSIDSFIDEVLKKTNISDLFFEFTEKLINENNDKLRDKILAILNGLTKSGEYNEALFEFSKRLLDYAKNSDMTLISLVNESCTDNIKKILYRQSAEVSELIVSFVNSNKNELQRMLEEAINETINEQDAAKKALLSMAKGSIMNSIAKNDIAGIASEYLQSADNRTNICILASVKIKQHLKTTTVSQLVNTLEQKGALSSKSLSKFLSDYISGNAENIADKILLYIKNSFKDEPFKKNINLRLINFVRDKVILSSKATGFLNNHLSIYLTKLFDKNISEFLKDLSQKGLKLNDNICNFLEHNKDKIVGNLSLNISNTIENKSLKDILSDDSLNRINMLLRESAYKKTSQLREEISEKKLYELYNKLNSIDDLHENSSKLLKSGVINNLSTLLHGFVRGLSVKNLSKLDDTKLVEMAKSFMGNNLKPIMLFGGMLGLAAGLILAFLQPNTNVFALISIWGALTYSVVGFLTNAIAINMLFMPYKEIRLIRNIPFLRHFSLGYIAKNKANLADSMSDAINEYLLTKDSMDELIDIYKDSIKANILHNISKNDYEAISNIFINNKDKIVNSICDYAVNAVSLNKSKLASLSADQLEAVKINDFAYDYKDKISEYIIASKGIYKEFILSSLTKMSGEGNSISSILPKSAIAYINSTIAKSFHDGYDSLLNMLNHENAKNLIGSYDEKYNELINKNISEFFSAKDLVSSDGIVNITNIINKNLNSSQQIGTMLNKRISEVSNKALYSFFEDVNTNSSKLLKLIHPYVSKAMQEKVTSNLNFLVKGAYNMMNGDKLIDTAVEKILSDKLPKLIERKKDNLYESSSDYLNTKLLSLRSEEFGILLNSNVIKDKGIHTFSEISKPISVFIDKKLSHIKVKTLLTPLSLDNASLIFSNYGKETAVLIDELNSALALNKNDIMSSFNVLIDKYISDLMNNTGTNLLFKNIEADDFKKISDNIANILLEDDLTDISINDILTCIRDYDKPIYISELTGRDNFIKSFEKTINDLFGTDESLDYNDTKLILKKIIDDVLCCASEKGFGFINSESKEYVSGKIADAVILSLRNNLSNILKDIEFDKITKEQINGMNPKKIHMMFNSFAGKYFTTLMLYGFWGAVFGINTMAGLVLSAVYGVKNLTNNIKN